MTFEPNFTRYTDSAKAILAGAVQLAQSEQAEGARAEQILCGVAFVHRVGYYALKVLGLDLALRGDWARGRRGFRFHPLHGKPPQRSAEGAAILELAEEESRLLGHDYVGTEHLVLGILKHGGNPAARFLAEVTFLPMNGRSEI